MTEAREGIEIPVILNPDGTVKGLEVIARKLAELQGSARTAGDALDKVGAAGGGKGANPAQGGGGPASGAGSFFESRMGELVKSISSAGLSFVERALPNIMDPTKSKVEAAMVAGPHAARLSAQLAAGATIAAGEASSGVELPETIKQQIIQTAGVAAEEAAKAAFAGLRAELDAAKGGVMSVLGPMAQMGHMPDAGTVDEMINSFRAMGKRDFALRKMVAERLDANIVSPVDDTLMKQVNGVSMLDSNGVIDSGVAQIGR